MKVAKSVVVVLFLELAAARAGRVESGEDNPLLQQNRLSDLELEQEMEDDARMASLVEMASKKAVRRAMPERESLVEITQEEPPVPEAITLADETVKEPTVPEATAAADETAEDAAAQELPVPEAHAAAEGAAALEDAGQDGAAEIKEPPAPEARAAGDRRRRMSESTDMLEAAETRRPANAVYAAGLEELREELHDTQRVWSQEEGARPAPEAAPVTGGTAANASKPAPWFFDRNGMADNILGLPEVPAATYEEGLAVGAAAAIMEEVQHPELVKKEVAGLKTFALLGYSQFGGAYGKISDTTKDFLRAVGARVNKTYEAARSTMDWSIGPLVLQEASSITTAQREDGKALVTLLAYADALDKQHGA